MNTRVCKICGETKEAVQGTWVVSRGKSVGRVCLTCSAAANMAAYYNDPDRLVKASAKSKRLRSTAEGRAKCSAASLATYYANPDRLAKGKAASKKFRGTEEGRVKNNKASLAWYSSHRSKACAKNAKRRALKLQRTPAWADFEKIDAVYAEAARLSRLTGVIYHVDHTIPLQGELVSGLHVHNNLQILTESANCSKQNKFVIGGI